MKQRERIQARAHRQQGKSLGEIAETLCVSKSSVSVWVRDIQLSKQQKKSLRQRELIGANKGNKTLQKKWREYRKHHPKPKGPRWPNRIAENFFNQWSPEMAYVLGYFAADGCMYENKRGSCYIGFTSTDKELIQTVKRVMNVSNRIETYKSKNGNWKIKYTLQIGSKKIYQQLLSMGFTPTKSLVMKFPPIPIQYLSHFVRGYFDGDGGVFRGVYFQKNREKHSIITRSMFTCGSRNFLSKLQQQLHMHAKMGKGSLVNKQKGGFSLQYSKADTRQLYYFMYPTVTVPCLSRKRTVFEKIF